MDNILTFADIAQRMESKVAKLEIGAYVNRRRLEGTTIRFFHFCEWFEVNVHDAVAMSPENVLKLLQLSPHTALLPDRSRGTYVEQGMKIGYVTDYFLATPSTKLTPRLPA